MMGKLIVLESLEAAGKGTASQYVKEYAADRSLPFVFTREPGGTPFAETIREHMLEHEGKVPPICQALLSYASRADHVEKVIRPALESGQHVFSERYYWSALAYQASTCPQTHAIHDLVHEAVNMPKPDLTILLDISPELSLERMHLTRVRQGVKLDEFEKKPIEYFRGVRDRYYAQLDDQWAVVDASQPLQFVQQSIYALLDKVLGISPYENATCRGCHQTS